MPRALLLALAALGPVSVGDPVEAIQAWGQGFERSARPTDDAGWSTLDRHLIDLRGYARASRAQRRGAATALLDLYAAGVGATRGPAGFRPVEGWRLRERVREEFAPLLVPELTRWLAQEVLVLGEGNPIDRRVAAALLLAEDESTPVRMALLLCARGGEPELAAAAGEALVGRDEPGVHQLFLQVLWRSAAPTPPALVGAAEDHFRRVHLAAGGRAAAELEAYLRERLTDEAWRSASRAAAVSAALPDERAVPLLIPALETWIARSEEGRPVRRLLHDLTRELRARSGLSLGPRPERWATWWDAVRSGQVEPRPREGSEGRTSASFFGLRPETDRVTFVLDRSGSMDEEFAPTGEESATRWTRYKESVAQMVRFLEGLGSRARFTVVLFSDDVRVWRSTLQPADRGQLSAARAWALRNPPNGGTQLRAGIERALHVDDEGLVDLETLEADTLIVLCDGETYEGPLWVEPFLRRVNPTARVVVHAVQVGSLGDGTLERLAAGTGGDFAQVRE